MKKYLFGLLAIAFAIGFSAYTKAPFATKLYKVTNKITSTSPQRYVLLNTTQFSSLTCDNGSDVCAIVFDDVTPPTIKHDTPGNYDYIEVTDANITSTQQGAFW